MRPRVGPVSFLAAKTFLLTQPAQVPRVLMDGEDLSADPVFPLKLGHEIIAEPCGCQVRSYVRGTQRALILVSQANEPPVCAPGRLDAMTPV